MATDNKKKLYNALSQDYDMGSYEQFCADIDDEGKRRKLYDATSQEYDYGSWESFSQQLGYGLDEPRVGLSERLQASLQVGEALRSTEKRMAESVEKAKRVVEGNSEQAKASAFVNRALADRAGVTSKLRGVPFQQTANVSGLEGVGEGTGDGSSLPTKEPVVHRVYQDGSGKTHTEWRLSDGTVTENLFDANADANLASLGRLQMHERQAAQFAESIPGQLVSARKELARLEKERGEHLEKLRGDDTGHWYDALGGAYGSRREDVPYDDTATGYDAAIRSAKERIQMLENKQDQSQHGGSFWRDFGRGTWQAVNDISAWDFGATDLTNSLTMRKISKKIEEGAELSEGEKAAMENAIYAEAVKQSLGDMGKGYRWGDIAGTSLSFMKDFVLTGGFSGFEGVAVRGLTKGVVKLGGSVTRKALAKELAKKGLLQFVRDNGAKGVAELAKSQGLRWTVKALGTTADDLLVRAPMMTGTVQGMGTMSKIMDAHTGVASVSDDGTFKFEDGQTWTRAAWEQGADQVIENFSEMWGAHLPGATEVTKAFGARNLTAAILKSTCI